MTLLVVNGGEVLALEYLVNKGTPENLTYGLFVNNITPAETDVIGDYTEAASGGYAAKTLTGSSWSVSGGAPSVATFARQDWGFTGALSGSASIYGYFVKRSSGGELVLAERLAAAFTPANNGDELRITPRITAD